MVLDMSKLRDIKNVQLDQTISGVGELVDVLIDLYGDKRAEKVERVTALCRSKLDMFSFGRFVAGRLPVGWRVEEVTKQGNEVVGARSIYMIVIVRVDPEGELE